MLIQSTSEPQPEQFRSDSRGLCSSGSSERLCKQARTSLNGEIQRANVPRTSGLAEKFTAQLLTG